MAKEIERREFLVKAMRFPCSAVLLSVCGPLRALADSGEGGSEAAEHS